jgi:hypothetical protein
MRALVRTLLAGFAVWFTLPPASAAVIYSRFLNFGTTGNTTIAAMTTDSAGNVYLTGNTNVTDFPVTSGVVQPVLGPGTCSTTFDPHSPPLIAPCPDAFIVKLDPNGNVLFATYLGGTGSDSGLAIAVDAQGAIYVAGTTIQQGAGLNNFPVTPGAAFTNESGGQWDAFVTKLNSTGTALVYSTLLPNGGQGPGVGLAVDAAGNAYFGGGALPSQGAFLTSHSATLQLSRASSIRWRCAAADFGNIPSEHHHSCGSGSRHIDMEWLPNGRQHFYDGCGDDRRAVTKDNLAVRLARSLELGPQLRVRLTQRNGGSVVELAPLLFQIFVYGGLVMEIVGDRSVDLRQLEKGELGLDGFGRTAALKGVHHGV